MASLLAWVDYSSTHRDDMDRLLDAFREKGTVDELGVGTIRDTFSDYLFPGTSTLHTRARYLLFIPWAVTTVTARRLPTDKAVAELRHLEVRLIESLRAGDVDGGVIGRDARSNLRRMPSVVYWGGLGAYDIRWCKHNVEQHLRFVTGRPPPSLDEDEDIRHLRHQDPCFRQLPAPPPNWLEVADFNLTRNEAEFLRDRILSSCRGRYLSWLTEHGIPGDPDTPWEPELMAAVPADIARALTHGQRLSQLHQGGAILYNLLLARQKDWVDGIEDYTDRFLAWSTSEETQIASRTWDETDFWHLLSHAGWRLRSDTKTYVSAWVSLVRQGHDLSQDSEAERLIRNRERQLKGSRSRFINPEALASWEGGTGMGRMTYRWAEAKALVKDIHDGLEQDIA